MSYTDDQRHKIAEVVRRARIDKRLDKEPAARAAGINSITWKRVEDAEGVRDASLSKILASLDLPSADGILADEAPRQPPWQVDHSVDISSDGLIHVVSLLWDTWRRFSVEVGPTLSPEAYRQLRRSMLLTADAISDLLGLVETRPEAQRLTAAITDFVNELFSNRSHQEDPDDMETATAAGTSSQAREGQEVSVDDAQHRPISDLLAAPKDPGVYGAKDGEKRHDLG